MTGRPLVRGVGMSWAVVALAFSLQVSSATAQVGGAAGQVALAADAATGERASRAVLDQYCFSCHK